MPDQNDGNATTCCCCCTIERDEDGWHRGRCCLGLQVLVAIVLFTLSVLLLQATDCDLQYTRIVAGTILLALSVLEIVSAVLEAYYQNHAVNRKLKKLNIFLEFGAQIFLMVVSALAITSFPCDCNHHGVKSLEMVASVSIIAMLVLHIYLAIKCWPSTIYTVMNPNRHNPQPLAANTETAEIHLFCLVCEVPTYGSDLVRLAGLPISLRRLCVLLDLLGCALVLAGLVLFFAVLTIPLITAAGVFTSALGSLSVVVGWIVFIKESNYDQETEQGRRKLDKVLLVLTSLLPLGIVDFCLLLGVIATHIPRTSKPTWPELNDFYPTWQTAAIATSLCDYDAHDVIVTVCVALALLLLLLLLANALLSRYKNLRFNGNDGLSIMPPDPERAPFTDQHTGQPPEEEALVGQEAEPSAPPLSIRSYSSQGSSSRACRICQDGDITQAFVPCGHYCTCSNCAMTLRFAAERHLRCCPICREPIQDTLSIFRA